MASEKAPTVIKKYANRRLYDTDASAYVTLDDLADLASDELLELVGGDLMDEEQANAVIMAARAHWFGDEVAEGS